MMRAPAARDAHCEPSSPGNSRAPTRACAADTRPQRALCTSRGRMFSLALPPGLVLVTQALKWSLLTRPEFMQRRAMATLAVLAAAGASVRVANANRTNLVSASRARVRKHQPHRLAPAQPRVQYKAWPSRDLDWRRAPVVSRQLRHPSHR